MRRISRLLSLGLWLWGAAGADAFAMEYKAKQLRDPFGDLAPHPSADRPVESERLISELELQGVVIGGEEGPRAIVSGRIVKVGSKLKIGEVTAISQKGVTVRYEGKDYLLKRKGKKPDENKFSEQKPV